MDILLVKKIIKKSKKNQKSLKNSKKPTKTCDSHSSLPL